MEDFWRVPFTILSSIPLAVSLIAFGILGLAAMYLIGGSIVFLSCYDAGLNQWRLIITWLPALWIERLADWSVR